MRFRLALMVKWCWLACSIGVLFITLYIYDGTPTTRDAELIMFYGMLALCFPVGQLLAIVLGAIGYLAEVMMYKLAIPTSYPTIVIAWIVLFAAGYWQWFKLVPWLWHKWKAPRVL
jgi:hypothetical protein